MTLEEPKRCPKCGGPLTLGEWTNRMECYNPPCHYKRCVERMKEFRVKKSIVIASMFVLAMLFSNRAHAQGQVVSGNKLGFDQSAPDLATANGYTYRRYEDGSTTGIVTTVTCADKVPVVAGKFDCSFPFPAFTPGVQHTIAVSASNVAGESLKSAPLPFFFVVIPAQPTNLRIISGDLE